MQTGLSRIGARRRLGLYLLGFVYAACLACSAAAQDAATLLARHAALREQLANNQFRQPVYLESSETDDTLKGEIYAVLDYPFNVVAPALQRSDNWCEILFLHLNLKKCEVSQSGGAQTLRVAIGRTPDQPADEAYETDFIYQVRAANATYLQVALHAATGPVGTKNYRIALEGAPLDARRTFIHLSYSYSYGMAARVATRLYLATKGRKKVGFTIVGRDEDGQPLYIGGVRGIVERSTMRYYLAVQAYLGALGMPASQQLEKRLQDWYTAAERHPAQLHEMSRNEYVAIKRREARSLQR